VRNVIIVLRSIFVVFNVDILVLYERGYAASSMCSFK